LRIGLIGQMNRPIRVCMTMMTMQFLKFLRS